MNISVKLAPKQERLAELIAWGATYKDAARILKKSIRTIENTMRIVYEKTEVTKSNELSAWFFCTHFNISMDLSPLARKKVASILLLFVILQLFNPNEFNMRTRRAKRARKSETEYVDYLNE